MEVVVIDNFSSDGSRNYLELLFPTVVFYWSTENLGFAKACNLGLKLSKGEYLLFLNPDTIVGEDCFKKCINFLQSNAESGLLGVRMTDENGRFLKESKRGFPSPVTSFFKLIGLAALFPRSKYFSKYYLGNLSESDTHEVDIIAGAFMMVKKEVLEVTGGFDEAFFMYGEDIDLSYRVQKQGYKNFYYPGVTIIHFKGKSTPQKNLHYVKMFYRAMRVFSGKHYGKRNAGLYNPGIQLAIGLFAIIANVHYWIDDKIKGMRRYNSGYRKQILVIGEREEYKSIHELSDQADGVDVMQFDYLYAEPCTIENFNNIERILDEHNIKEIIICEGKQSFKEIIRFTGLLKQRNISIGIHAAGSKSIAGGVLTGNNLCAATDKS